MLFRSPSRGLTPVVVGAADESDLGQAIVAEAPSAIALTGRTSLLELGGLARRARIAVGNDTGPMHATAALGCPSLVLFSEESDPARCAPRGDTVGTMRRIRLKDLPVADVLQQAAGLARLP